MIDFYGRRLNTYKALLHMHCTTSDGKLAPEEVIRHYAEAGYDAVAFTDHHATNPVSTWDGLGMTLLSGMEMHPMGPRGISWHIVAVGLPEDYSEYDREAPAQDVIDRAVQAGAVCICAHPYWSGFTSAEIASLKNLSAIEVYNTATRYIGKAYNMQVWDELSDAGIVLPAVAVDDTHRPRDLFKGWTMIAAKDASPASLLKALKRGEFYATQGPEITRLSFKDDVFEADFSPCVEVIGMTNLSRGYMVTVPDQEGPGEPCRAITTAQIKVVRRATPAWLRLQLRDREGRYAWSAPIMVPAEGV
ncbi:MAG: CehA/McbA family metallohydrolase [Lentisphaerae bacterium]|jgi:predicted metal-dependent phosphoesterase TrpH|nr:CehA/McbA family metallohydrolase [Lentisphaerota bacterium]